MKKSCDKTVEPFSVKASPKTLEEQIRKHAKTTMEIRSLYEQWYRVFHEGVMGNQEAYAQARDSRKELEKPNWVSMDVVLGVLRQNRESFTKKLRQFYDEWLVEMEPITHDEVLLLGTIRWKFEETFLSEVSSQESSLNSNSKQEQKQP